MHDPDRSRSGEAHGSLTSFIRHRVVNGAFNLFDHVLRLGVGCRHELLHLLTGHQVDVHMQPLGFLDEIRIA